MGGRRQRGGGGRRIIRWSTCTANLIVQKDGVGAGLPPDDVMQQQEFYHDILNVAPEVIPGLDPSEMPKTLPYQQFRIGKRK